MIEPRTERHVIKESHPYYPMLKDFCHQAKNLYNHANYLIRQEFIQNGKWLRYPDLDTRLKNDLEFPDYRAMPTAQCAQQVLKQLDQNWKSFFRSVKDWKAHPEKYKGRPKIPKYQKKDGYFLLPLTNQNARLNGSQIRFPKVFQGFAIQPTFLDRPEFVSFQQVRFLPEKHQIVAELVYLVLVPDTQPDNGHVIGIDLGVNNLAAAAGNYGFPAFAINGRPVKSMNQFANRKRAHYQAVLKQMNGKDHSKHLDRLWKKRDQKIQDYLHKASRYLVNQCVEQNVSKIVIGQNKGWKQEADLGKRGNQNFVQIPFAKLIQMISYKANEQGIAVLLTEESDTSGTSFKDQEEPIKGQYGKSRRIQRGLFLANDGTLVNADVNAAYQIIKKAIPIQWDRGCVLHPTLITV